MIDATCPLVTKVHVQARRYAADGYTVILIGHEGHEEVVGTMGEAPEATILVQDVAEAEALDLPTDTRIAYITQTTLSVDETSEIIAVLRRRFPQVYAPRKEDICYATSNRQWAVKEMLAEIDLLLVLGSKNSSNSNRLVDVARASGVAGHLIDDETEIDERWLDGVRTVGISSGASAPERLVTRAVRLVPGARRGADRAVPDGQRGRHVQVAGGAAARADPRRDPALTVPAPTLAVVIPATDRPATLDRCLAAIARGRRPARRARRRRPTPPGAGPAAARNRGVARDDRRRRPLRRLRRRSSTRTCSPACGRRSRAIRASSASSARTTTPSPPTGTVAAFRNLLHHVVHQRSAGHVASFWAGIGAVRRDGLRRRRRIRRRAATRSRRSRTSSSVAGWRGRAGFSSTRRSRARTSRSGRSRSMVRTDFGRRGVPWVSLLVSRRELPATLNLGARERASVVAALAVAWGIVRRRPLAVAAGVGAEVALNRDLLALLHERLGPRGAIAGVGLHTVHQLTAVAAVPAGLLARPSRRAEPLGRSRASAASSGFCRSLSSRYSASALTAHTSLSAPSRRFSVPSTAVHIEWSWLL